MRQNIIGRESEIERLGKYIASSKSEFIAVYGRRRVGKTFLIKEMFEGQFCFRVTGKEKATTKEQIDNFCFSLTNFFSRDAEATTWEEAFRLLEKFIERQKPGTKILFFDELPWMDTPKSKFLSVFEHFWNDWAQYRNDIKLICCGSATTWMLDNVIRSRGGLHNRATHSIHIAPFTLNETERYFQAEGFPYERQEIIECYMAVGGVAYYLSLFESDKSVAENIEQLCFTRGGELTDEFNKLYRSLFKKPDKYMKVITALNNKGKGMSRLQLIEATKSINNGNFTSILDELEECDFIRSYSPYKASKKMKLYQLIDPFTLFYFRFMQGKSNFLKGYWMKMQSKAEYDSWCGYAFEIVCLNHLDEIVHALGIDGSINTICSWNYVAPKDIKEDADVDEDLKTGAQIDLLIDRSDRTVNVCEIKYCDGEYEIKKAYYDHVMMRLRTFQKVTGTHDTLTPVFITPFGLTSNMYSRKMPRQITGDMLFQRI